MEAHISKAYNIMFHCLYPLEIDHDWMLQFYFHRIEHPGLWQDLKGSVLMHDSLKESYSQLNYLGYDCFCYPLVGIEYNSLLQDHMRDGSFRYLPGFIINETASGYGLFF